MLYAFSEATLNQQQTELFVLVNVNETATARQTIKETNIRTVTPIHKDKENTK